MGKYAKRLAAADENWKNAEAGFPEIPPGEYVGQVRSAEVKETNSGNLCAVVNIIIGSGEQQGANGSVWFTLEGENENAVRVGMATLKEMFEKLGREVPESMADVEDALEVLGRENPVVTVKAEKSKKGDRVFLRITGVADAGDMAAEAVPQPETPADADAGAEETGAVDDDVVDGARVQFESEGKTYAGTVTAVAGDTATVQTDDGENWEDVPLDVLTILEGTAEAEENPDLAELVAFAQAQEIAVDDGMGLDDVLELVKGKKYSKAELTADEIALLGKHGVPVRAPMAKVPAKAAPAKAPAKASPAKVPAKAPAKPAAKAKLVARKK